MKDNIPAFEIFDPKSGHRWMIYADGQISGFGPSVVVINRIPEFMMTAAFMMTAEEAVNQPAEA